MPMTLSFGSEKGEKSQKKWAMEGNTDFEKKTTHWQNKALTDTFFTQPRQIVRNSVASH